MASLKPYLVLIPLIFLQNVFSQVLPIGNGCYCQKPPLPQNQLINLQMANPGCNCQSNSPFRNIPLNLPVNQLPVMNGLQINNMLPYNNRPQFTNVPNYNIPVGNWPVINNLPLNNVPVYNNMPVANLPLLNVPIGNNIPINNIPLNGLQANNWPVNNRLPFNNINYGNMPVRNNLPFNNFNLLPNVPIGNNLPVNCIDGNGMPINIPNCIQVPNANLPLINNMPFTNNFPTNINPQLSNLNVMPVNNFAINPPNNIQFTNVPNGLLLNQLPNGVNQQNFQNIPVKNECGCNQSGLSVLVENGLANSPGNPQTNAPVVSMNGLQLNGLGGLGNLPLFNGLPVIDIQESVVNLNPQCNCHN